jgi:hypothetical protein
MNETIKYNVLLHFHQWRNADCVGVHSGDFDGQDERVVKSICSLLDLHKENPECYVIDRTVCTELPELHRLLRDNLDTRSLTIDGTLNARFKGDIKCKVYTPELECMKSHMDGAHCGLADWYPEIEAGIVTALNMGPDAGWSTGWYGSKKEIASCRITHGCGRMEIEVSVSDDFDTQGIGYESIGHTEDLEVIRKAIYSAWDQASDDQKDNREYAMYIIGKEGQDGNRINWIGTYLMDTSDFGTDTPPGDYYHQWGWQEETDEIPEATLKRLESAIHDWQNPIRIGGFVAELSE